MNARLRLLTYLLPTLVLAGLLAFHSAHATGWAAVVGWGVLALALATAGWSWRRWRQIDTLGIGQAWLAMALALPVVGMTPLLAMGWGMWALCLMPSLGSTRLVVVSGVALGGLPLALGAQWSSLQIVLGLQTLVLALRSHELLLQRRENEDVAFLIRAMGEQGPVRLDLAVLKAESSLGRRLRTVQDRMAEALRQARTAAEQVQSASAELGQDSSQLILRTERGAAGLRDIVMTLEQISVIVKTSAEAAMQARATAEHASAQAEKGAAMFSNVVHTMRDIDRASREIADIIGVIDGIAFQTNILALNAAVEAARAGEQGRGFAVVAGEVRSLAMRSAASAAQIKKLIERSGQTVHQGATLVDNAGVAMNEIVLAVRNVGDVFATLSADTSEHAGSIETVTGAVREVDQTTRDNAVMAASLGQLAAELHQHGQQLEAMLGAFKLGDQDGTAPGEPSGASTPVTPITGAPPQVVAGGVLTGVAAQSPQQHVLADLPPVHAAGEVLGTVEFF